MYSYIKLTKLIFVIIIIAHILGFKFIYGKVYIFLGLLWHWIAAYEL